MTDVDKFPGDSGMLFAALETLPPQDQAKIKVASMVKDHVLEVDKSVANEIGFDGHILDQVANNYDLSGGINKSDIPSQIRPYISGSNFNYGNSTLLYTIHSKFGLSPEIEFQNQDGTTINFYVSDASKKEGAFRRITLTNKFKKGGNVISSREVRTFVPNSNSQEPEYPLEISLKFGTGFKMTVEYANIQANGDVKLLDGQLLTIRDTEGRAPDIYGKYSANEGRVIWNVTENNIDRIAKTTTITDGNTLTITEGENTFLFPLSTNIYTEIQDMVANRSSH